MENKKQYLYDIEELLKSGNAIQIKPFGYSMYPLFIPGRDEAIIEPLTTNLSSLKKGDVILFRRPDSILVLHRIYKIKDTEIYAIGDNQPLSELEGPIEFCQIKGILSEIIRNNKKISVKNPAYILLTRLWLFLIPIRPFLSKTAYKIKSFFSRK